MSDLKSAVVKYGSVAAPLAAYVAVTGSARSGAMAALEGGVAAALADYALPANSNMQPLATGAALGAYSFIINRSPSGALGPASQAATSAALNTAVQVALLSAAGAYIGSKYVLPWVQKQWGN